MDRKVTVPVINGVKQMIEAGAKQKYIAKAFNVSVATIQNVKKTGFNYNSYNNLVSRQLNRWKLNKSIGLFIEGEYTKFWDSEIYNSSIGLNVTLR